MPKISVVMPVYNAEKYLREAMDSILNQTYTDFEFIILDDGSKDTSPDIVRSYSDPRIRFYQNEHNMGVAATLNRGLDLATGEYIARMDSDDISLPERFEKQVTYLDAHPEIAVLATDVQTFGAKNFYSPTSKKNEELRVDLIFNCCLCHPTVMMRGSLVQQEQFFYDPAFNKMEDYELWVRISEQHQLACLDQILFKYRVHPQQVTQNSSTEISEQYRSLKLRILAPLGITDANNGFEAFNRYCFGNRALTALEKDQLADFLLEVLQANQKLHVYDENLLKQSIRNIIYANLNTSKDRRKFLRQYSNLFEDGISGRVLQMKFWLRSFCK